MQAGELGRQKIVNNYSLDDVVLQYEAIMTKVAQKIDVDPQCHV